MNKKGELTEKDQIDTVIKALKERGFDARYAENKADARKLVLEMIPEHWVVGCGDSATIRSLNVFDELRENGHYTLNSYFFPKVMKKNRTVLPLRIMKLTQSASDVFLLSANAVTLDGRIVNADGGGMRVAGMFFGPLLTIMVVGRNKIARDLNDAFYRIHDIIAPVHHRTNRKEKPPEAYLPIDPARCLAEINQMEPGQKRYGTSSRLTTGNITVVLEGRPAIPDSNVAVIMVNEDLGLGWDPAWPQERKDKIFLEYQKYTPPHRPVANA